MHKCDRTGLGLMDSYNNDKLCKVISHPNLSLAQRKGRRGRETMKTGFGGEGEERETMKKGLCCLIRKMLVLQKLKEYNFLP